MELAKLKECLEKHLKWLKNEDGGERADLYGADLREADLYEADLREADLREADLYEADLRGADLRGANLREADLLGANLLGANLRGANLLGANLRGANLLGASLRGANLPPELLTKFFPFACPEEGAFIGWKKAHAVVDSTILKQVIVKLQIPEDARRSSAFGRKCRCDKAVVLAVESIDGSRAEVDLAVSQHDSNFYYRVGETVSVDNFDTDRTHECAPGIHFFITRQEAVDY